VYASATPAESDDLRAAAHIVSERETVQTRPMSRRENLLYQRDVLSGFARGSCYSSRLRLVLSTQGNCLVIRVSTLEKNWQGPACHFSLCSFCASLYFLSFRDNARKILFLKSSEAKREKFFVLFHHHAYS